MSLSTSLGAAFRKRGPRASRKGDSASACSGDDTSAEHAKTAIAQVPPPSPIAQTSSMTVGSVPTPPLSPSASSVPPIAPPHAAPEIRLPQKVADFALPSAGHGNTSRYRVRREDRSVVLEVSPTGVTVIDGEAQFHHLTTILSWRVRRSESSQPVGFKLVFTDGAEITLGTEQGREISDVMMRHAQGLASLMHGGMHVRGTAMVN